MALEAMSNTAVNLLALDQGLQDPQQARTMLVYAVVTEKHTEALRLIAACVRVFPDVTKAWSNIREQDRIPLTRSVQALAGSPLYAYSQTYKWNWPTRIILEYVARYALGNYVEAHGLEDVLERLVRRRENIYWTSRTRALDLFALITAPGDVVVAEETTRALLGCPHVAVQGRLVSTLSVAALDYILAVTL